MAPRNQAKLTKKQGYISKLKHLLATVPNILIVHTDNVGSNQMQQIRLALRGKAILLMGKNTMIRTSIRQYQSENLDQDMSKLLEIIHGNIGFIFCMDSMDSIRNVISEHKVPAAAKAGTLAPIDVFVPAGPTGLDPSQTSFFQALNIATKIVKGSVEIVSEVHLVKAGVRVSASEQALLLKLDIKPFAYGLEIRYIIDNGTVFDAAVLDITDDVLIEKFSSAVGNVAAFSREVGIPTEASLPHAIASAFKNIAAFCSDLDITFPEIKQIKAFLKDPSAFAITAPLPAAAAAGGAQAEAAEAVTSEKEEDDEDVMGFDLFD